MVTEGMGARMNQKAKYIIGRPTVVMHKCLG